MTTDIQPDGSQTTTRLFAPDALREKYRRERDRRLRPDGNEQYVEVTGTFARYLDTPTPSRSSGSCCSIRK